MARFTDTKQPKTPTAPRPDNFRTYLAVRRSRFVPREAPLRDASNSPVSSPARALRIATPRTCSPAARTPQKPAAAAPSKSAARRPASFDACALTPAAASPGVLRGGSPAEASIESYVPAFDAFGVPMQQSFAGGLPATPSPVRAPALALPSVTRAAALLPSPKVMRADAAPRPSPKVGDPPPPKVPPSKKSGGASSLFARLAQDRAPPPQPGRRKTALVGGARFAAGAAPSKMRGVVSARLRCTKCAHDVSRFPGYRWRPTAAYLHFRNYHPDRARLLEEAEAADGHAAYCCQCAWLDALELRDLGCDHAWVGY